MESMPSLALAPRTTTERLAQMISTCAGPLRVSTVAPASMGLILTLAIALSISTEAPAPMIIHNAILLLA